jgi:hypothetical protein
MRTACSIIAAGLLGACHRPPAPPPAPPPPPAVSIPAGCAADLSGRWEHAVAPGFRYRAIDDGGTVTLTVERVEVPDAGFRPRRLRDAGAPGPEPLAADAGQALIDAGAPPPRVELVLTRSPAGFSGQARLTVRHPEGRECTAAFPAEVVACGDGGLVISAAVDVSLDPGCQPVAPGPAAWATHHLRRPAAP